MDSNGFPWFSINFDTFPNILNQETYFLEKHKEENYKAYSIEFLKRDGKVKYFLPTIQSKKL